MQQQEPILSAVAMVMLETHAGCGGARAKGGDRCCLFRRAERRREREGISGARASHRASAERAGAWHNLSRSCVTPDTTSGPPELGGAAFWGEVFLTLSFGKDFFFQTRTQQGGRFAQTNGGFLGLVSKEIVIRVLVRKFGEEPGRRACRTNVRERRRRRR